MLNAVDPSASVPCPLFPYPSALAFGFVTPLFFAAGLALPAIPILIHILNRRRFKIVDWAAMEFLLRAMRKNRRRIQFEQMLLLATRCLLLLLLGMALSRPFGCDQNSIANLAGRHAGLHVFVIDNSYSMAYQAARPDAKTHLDQAKKTAKAMIDRLAGGSEAIAIVTTARPATAVLVTPTYDLEAAKQSVDRVAQSYRATDLVGAIDAARQIAAASANLPSKTLYLFDDSTRSAWATPQAESLKQAGPLLAAQFTGGIVHFDLSKPGQWNQAVIDLRPSARVITTDPDSRTQFIADLQSFGTGSDPQLIWRYDGAILDAAGSTSVHLDQNRQPISQGNIQTTTGGPHVVSASINSDNRLPADDTRSRVVDVASELKVLIVEGERGVGSLGSSGAYLRYALHPDASAAGPGPATSSYVGVESISDLELANKTLDDYRCVALCGVGQITESTAARLEKFVTSGGAVWIFMGDAVSAENYNATLLKHHLLPGALTKRVTAHGDASGRGGRNFEFNPHGQLDPVLADFKDQEKTGLDTAEIFSYWQTDLAPDAHARVVLNYAPEPGTADRDPAITLHSVGAGQVIFYSTAADANDEWTTFPAKQAYVALMHELVLGTITTGDDWMNLTVGDRVQTPPRLHLTQPPLLKDSTGNVYPLTEVPTADGQLTYKTPQPLESPGVYTLITPAGNYPLAVNVPAADEADIRPVDGPTIKNILGGIDVQLESDQLPAQAALASKGNDFGWSIMLAVLALAAAESAMARAFGHHRRR